MSHHHYGPHGPSSPPPQRDGLFASQAQPPGRPVSAVPGSIRAAAGYLLANAGLMLIGTVAAFVAASATLGNIEDRLGPMPTVGIGGFIAPNVYGEFLMAIVVTIVAIRLPKGANGARITALVFSAFAALSGLASVITAFTGASADLAELQRLTETTYTPVWQTPTVIVLGLVHIALAVMVFVKLRDKDSSAWFAAGKQR